MKRADPIPFPELPEAGAVSSALFWRAAWLRALAELTALQRFTQRRSFSKESKPLRYALYGAEADLRREVANDLKSLVNCGGLLYAWAPDSQGGAA